MCIIPLKMSFLKGTQTFLLNLTNIETSLYTRIFTYTISKSSRNIAKNVQKKNYIGMGTAIMDFTVSKFKANLPVSTMESC